ncbi:MAG TPA: hypothetical protein PKZ01_15220, partial [Candidatus Hydrogenedentes bacterium]|nr:hypothetical protein [Candidatus Hydrogenedentota bacterium]
MRYLSDCRILSNAEVAPGQFRMRVRAQEIASAAQPGQFVMTLVSEGLHPFLRRPLCFERIHPDDGVVSLLYKIEGEGTRLLSRHAPGQTVSLQGPLGNGFPIDTTFQRHIIVAGGIGVACFPALTEAIARKTGAPPEVILAARTRSLLLCEEDFRDMGCTLHIATDDGSAGEKAYAAQALERLSPGPDARVYACGPMIMMQTVANVAAAAGAVASYSGKRATA